MTGRSEKTKQEYNGGSYDGDENYQENLLREALERTKSAMFHERFIPRKFYPPNALYEPSAIDDVRSVAISAISIVLTNEPILFTGPASSSTAAGPIHEEAYSLYVPAAPTNRDNEIIDYSDTIEIMANTAIGGMHALQTLFQLFYAHSSSTKNTTALYALNAPIQIADAPAFSHRGLNLDIARNVISPGSVIRVIDGMSLNKLNRLHIHAADAQSWPLEIPNMPELAVQGAYNGGYYDDSEDEYDKPRIWTVSDLEHVQQYGRARGVQVYLEIDIPGHTAAIAQSHPELVIAAYAAPWYSYAAEPPAGQLLLNSNAVREFLSRLLDEDLLSRATVPFTSLFHFGGDEVNRNVYTLDKGVSSSEKDVLRPMLQELVDHVAGMAKKHGVTPIFWEEMVLDWDLGLPREAIVQTWRGAREPRDDSSDDDVSAIKTTNSLIAVLQRGHRALFGANSHWYLDCGHGSFLDPADDKNDNFDINLGRGDSQNVAHEPPKIQPPYNDYCSPYKNWRQVYTYDPLEEAEADDNDDDDNESQCRHKVKYDSSQILGGEVHLWTEQTDALTLDAALWPRVAAAAEVLWRGGEGNDASASERKHSKITSDLPSRSKSKPNLKLELSESVTRRLAEMRERLVRKKIRAGVVTMEWCLRNRGGCVV